LFLFLEFRLSPWFAVGSGISGEQGHYILVVLRLEDKLSAMTLLGNCLPVRTPPGFKVPAE